MQHSSLVLFILLCLVSVDQAIELIPVNPSRLVDLKATTPQEYVRALNVTGCEDTVTSHVVATNYVSLWKSCALIMMTAIDAGTDPEVYTLHPPGATITASAVDEAEEKIVIAYSTGEVAIYTSSLSVDTSYTITQKNVNFSCSSLLASDDQLLCFKEQYLVKITTGASPTPNLLLLHWNVINSSDSESHFQSEIREFSIPSANGPQTVEIAAVAEITDQFYAAIGQVTEENLQVLMTFSHDFSHFHYGTYDNNNALQIYFTDVGGLNSASMFALAGNFDDKSNLIGFRTGAFVAQVSYDKHQFSYSMKAFQVPGETSYGEVQIYPESSTSVLVQTILSINRVIWTDGKFEMPLANVLTSNTWQWFSIKSLAVASKSSALLASGVLSPTNSSQGYPQVLKLPLATLTFETNSALFTFYAHSYMPTVDSHAMILPLKTRPMASSQAVVIIVQPTLMSIMSTPSLSLSLVPINNYMESPIQMTTVGIQSITPQFNYRLDPEMFNYPLWQFDVHATGPDEAKVRFQNSTGSVVADFSYKNNTYDISEHLYVYAQLEPGVAITKQIGFYAVKPGGDETDTYARIISMKKTALSAQKIFVTEDDSIFLWGVARQNPQTKHVFVCRTFEDGVINYAASRMVPSLDFEDETSDLVFNIVPNQIYEFIYADKTQVFYSDRWQARLDLNCLKVLHLLNAYICLTSDQIVTFNSKGYVLTSYILESTTVGNKSTKLSVVPVDLLSDTFDTLVVLTQGGGLTKLRVSPSGATAQVIWSYYYDSLRAKNARLLKIGDGSSYVIFGVGESGNSIEVLLLQDQGQSAFVSKVFSLPVDPNWIKHNAQPFGTANNSGDFLIGIGMDVYIFDGAGNMKASRSVEVDSKLSCTLISAADDSKSNLVLGGNCVPKDTTLSPSILIMKMTPEGNFNDASHEHFVIKLVIQGLPTLISHMVPFGKVSTKLVSTSRNSSLVISDLSNPTLQQLNFSWDLSMLQTPQFPPNFEKYHSITVPANTIDAYTLDLAEFGQDLGLCTPTLLSAPAFIELSFDRNIDQPRKGAFTLFFRPTSFDVLDYKAIVQMNCNQYFTSFVVFEIKVTDSTLMLLLSPLLLLITVLFT